MGQIEQGLERALRTRRVPSSSEARLRFLLATHQGSTWRVAAVLGVSQRTVQRWVTRKPGARRPSGPLQVGAIGEAVLARWQPRVRARRRARAEAEGFVFHTRARFGFAAPAGSSDDPRVRWITQYLPGEVARELFVARNVGAGEQQQLVILAARWGTPISATGADAVMACISPSLTWSSPSSRSGDLLAAGNPRGRWSQHCVVLLGFLLFAPVPLDAVGPPGGGRLRRAQPGRLSQAQQMRTVPGRSEECLIVAGCEAGEAGRGPQEDARPAGYGVGGAAVGVAGAVVQASVAAASS
ncbi:telomere-protecting terminal protein Tpg [Streptomyces fungicidicus]